LHGKLLFSVESTSETHLLFASVPTYSSFKSLTYGNDPDVSLRNAVPSTWEIFEICSLKYESAHVLSVVEPESSA
jgi:hypothetical protein